MKLITVIVEHPTAEGVAVALPRTGVTSATISEVHRIDRDATLSAREFRVELLVEEHAVDYVMAGLSFAVSAGLLRDCKGAWITPAQPLTNLPSAPGKVMNA